MKTKLNSNLRKTLNIDAVTKLRITEGKSLVETAKLLNVSTSTLSRFNKENNIYLNRRCLEDPPTKDLLKSNIEKMLKEEHLTITNICKKLHINYNTYAKIYGKGVKSIKNSIDSNIVNLKNKDFCYMLGLLIADGHIDDNIIYISQCNASYLKKLQHILKHTGNIVKATNTQNPCYRITLTDAKLREFLNLYKIEPDKRYTAPYIECGNLDTHFIRGLFDGDGCLYYSYVSGKLKQRRVEISTGSPFVKDGVCAFLTKYNIPYTVYKDKNKNICYKIFIDVIADIIRFLNLIYKDKGDCFLDKKYYSFIKFEKLVKMNKQVNDIVDGLGETL